MRVRVITIAIVFVSMLSAGSTTVWAQTTRIMGQTASVEKGRFEVDRDVNVRAGPGTSFARVDGLNAGEQVRVLARSTDGNWLAVSRDGVTLGFVFAQTLVPLLDGALNKEFFGTYPLTGKGPAAKKPTAKNPAPENNVACTYRVRFERKAGVEGDVFKTSDYEIRFRCTRKRKATLFYAHMFLSEAPVNKRKGLYQIGLEARSIGDGFEKYLITTYMYAPITGTVTFVGNSMARFAHPPTVRTFKTTSIHDALKQVLDTSIASWTLEAWDSVFAIEK